MTAAAYMLKQLRNADDDGAAGFLVSKAKARAITDVLLRAEAVARRDRATAENLSQLRKALERLDVEMMT